MAAWFKSRVEATSTPTYRDVVRWASAEGCCVQSGSQPDSFGLTVGEFQIFAKKKKRERIHLLIF